MLFCAKAKRLAADIAAASCAAATPADTARHPNIHHAGDCRLRLHGEPAERDLLPRATQTRSE